MDRAAERGGMSRAQTALLAAFGAIAPIAIDMYLPGIPAMARDLAVSPNNAGTSVSVFFVGMAVGQLFAGPMSDRIGRRPMMIGGLALFTLGGIGAAASGSFALLLGARLVQALGACSVTTCSRAAVRDRLDPREAARLFSLLALVGGLIPLAAPTLGSIVLQLAGWRAMFAAMAAAGALMLAAMLRTLPESRSHATLAQSRGENPLRAYASLLRRPTLLWTLLAASLNSGGMFSYLANSPAVLMEGFGMTPFAYTAAISVNSLGLVLFSQMNRQWLHRHQPEDVLARVSLVMAALGLAFMAYASLFAGSEPMLLVLLFALLCCAALVQVNGMACALAVDPTRSGSTAALFGAATFATGALLSWIAGRCYTRDGAGLALVVGLAVLGCACALRMMLRARRLDQAAA